MTDKNPLLCRLYDAAFGRFLGDAALDAVRQDPLLGGVSRRRLRHHGGSRNIVDGRVAEYEGRSIETSAIFQDDWTRYGLLDEHSAALQQMGDQLLEGQKQMLLDGVSLASDVAGNTKDFGGQKLDQEGLLDIYASLPWRFDERGRVDARSFAMVVAPEAVDKMKELFATMQEHPRWAEVFARKLEEWRASRQERRLEAREVD